jgi:hypothetical protein
MPDQIAKSMSGVTLQQRQAMRTSYNEILAGFESEARKNNIAIAITFACRMSLRALNGSEMSPAEFERMAMNFNNALAANPYFLAMTPAQKQVLYESLIITGGTVGVLQMDGIRQNDSAMQWQAKELGQMVLHQWLAM